MLCTSLRSAVCILTQLLESPAAICLCFLHDLWEGVQPFWEGVQPFSTCEAVEATWVNLLGLGGRMEPFPLLPNNVASLKLTIVSLGKKNQNVSPEQQFPNLPQCFPLGKTQLQWMIKRSNLVPFESLPILQFSEGRTKCYQDA